VTTVLVVDDEPPIARALQINLRAHGYAVTAAVDGAGALRAAAESPPDAVVLDLGLPDIDGVEVIAGLRGWTTVPIIVLSARTDAADKIEALDAGADSYMTKPFDMDELLARLRGTLRRSAMISPADVDLVLDVGPFTVDLAIKKIRRDGVEVHLTPTEWALLELLVRNEGCLLTQRQLLSAVWGPDHVDDAHYLRLYIAHLRYKLEPDPSRPRYLITEPGVGYRFTTANP
jgi:two-component system KDP operon response regulator KdpE